MGQFSRRFRNGITGRIMALKFPVIAAEALHISYNAADARWPAIQMGGGCGGHPAIVASIQRLHGDILLRHVPCSQSNLQWGGHNITVVITEVSELFFLRLPLNCIIGITPAPGAGGVEWGWRRAIPRRLCPGSRASPQKSGRRIS